MNLSVRTALILIRNNDLSTFEYSCLEVVDIALGHNVDDDIFYGNGFAKVYVGNVVVFYVSAIYDNHAAGADSAELRAIGNYDAGIFSQANAYGAGLRGHSLGEAVESAAFIEMGIDNNVLHESETCGDLYFAF